MRIIKRKSIAGTNNPNYKHGLTHNKKCPDCGKPITYYSKRCRKCYSITQRKVPITYCCKDCGIKIGRYTALYGNSRCKSCSSKGILSYNWKGGWKNNLPLCNVCGKLLSSKGYTRCQSCSTKGKRNPRYGKRASHGKRIKYADIYFRSTWEVAFAQYLDKNNIKWFYEATTFYGEDYSYTPDFYLPETKEHIEIKGWWRDKAKKKFELFKKDFPNIKLSVYTEPILFELGLVNKGGKVIKC